MHRLFVAVRPPQEICGQLMSIMGGVAGARWQSLDQLHITLRFIGEVEGQVANDVANALSAVRVPPFTAVLSGVGTFERRGTPATLWAGVLPHEPFQLLHKKVDQACIRTGLDPERRAYRPHITLARLKPPAAPLDAFLQAASTFQSAPFEVNAFALYESTLTPHGAEYSIVERYPLA